METETNKVNWGTQNIPETLWIKPEQQYRTREGYRVIGLEVKLHNSTGHEVTYPVKGAITKERQGSGPRYSIWSLDGRANVLANKGHRDDLIPCDLQISEKGIPKHWNRILKTILEGNSNDKSSETGEETKVPSQKAGTEAEKSGNPESN